MPLIPRKALVASAMVTEMAILVGLGIVGGTALDRHTGTDPLFTILFTFSGMGLGLYRLHRLLRTR